MLPNSLHPDLWSLLVTYSWKWFGVPIETATCRHYAAERKCRFTASHSRCAFCFAHIRNTHAHKHAHRAERLTRSNIFGGCKICLAKCACLCIEYFARRNITRPAWRHISAQFVNICSENAPQTGLRMIAPIDVLLKLCLDNARVVQSSVDTHSTSVLFNMVE